MPADLPDSAIIERLYAVIASRRGADPAQSYTARLLAGGPAYAARKMGEEAVETIVAAVEGRPQPVVAESADLIYHLMVVWAALGITPDQVFAELARREGVSGHDEKRARG